MPTPFADHLLKPLALSRPSSPTIPETNVQVIQDSFARRTLQSLFVSLNGQPLSGSLAGDIIQTLMRLEQPSTDIDAVATDSETGALKKAILDKLVIDLYAESIENCLTQATDAETKAEWWGDIERSYWRVSLYLLQTSPIRLVKLVSVVLQTLRTQNLPLRLSVLTPTFLRQLFPSDRPFINPLNKALFPHLRHQPFSIASSTILFSSKSSTEKKDGILTGLWPALAPMFFLLKLPIELTRQECNYKSRELEKVRNRKAAALGRLANVRGNLALAIKEPQNTLSFIRVLTCIVNDELSEDFDAIPESSINEGSSEVLPILLHLSTVVFTSQKANYQCLLDFHELHRPSRLTLIWPQLLFIPPLCIYTLRTAYTSRASLVEIVNDAKGTLEALLKGWLIDPLKDILRTVRTGGEDGVIVRKEGVAADFESLERMALSLAEDQLHYGPEQLSALSRQIKLGDLTPVLQLYEEDIKRPLKSALTGTLLRSVFIQVQKAKVDIDQALAGIDKLLKSQELTFAFVGVAPVFGIVYLVTGSFLALLRGGRRVGKYGGKQKIGGAWFAMRRIERLLISQPTSHQHNGEPTNDSIPPLTSGLLLLSVARLRAYAEMYLPARSRLREGFLEDVSDLENPDLGRREKMRVLDRMWRCWGGVLGWGRIAGEDSKR